MNSRNIYKITFFKNQVDATEWSVFFNTLFASVYKLEISVVVQNTQIDFYVGCNKKIDLLNSRLFPFFFE